MRRAAKKDDNHNEIAKAFRALGCGWIDTYQFGSPMLDGLAEINTETWMIEIKDGAKPKSARKLTVGETKSFSTWRGKMAIIESLSDVVALVNKVRQGLR
jgi:hypothetical protein